MRTLESQGNADTALTEIAYLSAQNPAQAFHSLMHHINEGSLRRCFDKLDGKKALGIDGISKAAYGENLPANLHDLIARMKRMAYRPQAVRQVLIPKEGKAGATRPLGISNFEDKLVQYRVQELLGSIYEPIFLDWSYGFRPGRSCHDAISDLCNHLYSNEVEVVIDVDLANFFGTIDHGILKDLLSVKVKDTKFMRYISRMLKAGILVEGELSVSDEGVPQGSCASPIFSNIVAHYVIDEWLEDIVMPLMKGTIKAVRYADDLVICCRYEEDAIRVRKALGKRLDKYKLKLNEEKTKMVNFSKNKTRRGIKQEAFDFLGFTFYLGRSLKGNITPKVKTCGKRYRSKLNKIKDWARQIRNRESLGSIWKTFCAKLRGHVQYYGVSFNSKAVAKFLREAEKILFKWLNRRSQRKSFDWDKFRLFQKIHPLPEAKVRHRLF
ncbi:MAG: group II intron reverse transcriptase/maturase [bacterium]|nr:group II intron reverse transcriptase/maturase [Sphingobacteriia bacterium]